MSNPVCVRPQWLRIVLVMIALSICSAARATDCDSNGVDDATEIAAGTATDCNSNGTLDTCDLPGDFDGDELVRSGADFTAFAGCVTSPCSDPPCDPLLFADRCCALADYDSDGDVDLADFAATQRTAAPFDCNSNGVADVDELTPAFVEHIVGPNQRPLWIVAADMDGDNDVDVISSRRPGAEYYENTNGVGDFATSILVSGLTNRINDIAAADLDSDEDSDVIVASQNGMVWAENVDGQGSFSPGSRIALTQSSQFVVPADIDGDGDIDLVTQKMHSITGIEALGWHENQTGLGGFGLQNVISPPDYSSITPADIDNDGDIDLVTDEISWFENTNGLGQFSAPIPVSTSGIGPVLVTDIDGDNDLDLIAVDDAGLTTQIVQYLNTNGKGGFAAPTVISGSGEQPVRVVVADLDNDGNDDVAATINGPYEIGWYQYRTGPSQYGPIHEIVSQTAGLSVLVAADVDGDGDLDLLSGSSSAQLVVWFENIAPDCNGNGVLDECEVVASDCNANAILDECELRGGRAKDCNSNGVPDECDIAGGTTPDRNSNGLDDRCETANDCNNTGAPDDCEVAAGSSDDCDASGTPDECDSEIQFDALDLAELNFTLPLNMAPADLDGDGDIDIAWADHGPGVQWDENTNGAGGFRRRLDFDTEDGAQGATSVEAVDIDADGDIDLVAGAIFDNKVVWFPNDGSGDFGPQIIISENPVGSRTFDQWVFLDSGDIDGDGDVDVVSSSSIDHVVAWHPNTNGVGGFGERQVIAVMSLPRAIALADIDGDDDLDLVATSDGEGRVVWYANTNGTGGFGAASDIASNGIAPWWVEAADLDGDQDEDVLMGSPSGLVAWYQNINTSGVFDSRPPIFEGAFGCLHVIAADLDLDGDLDVMSASLNDHTVRWYENLDGLGYFAFPVDLWPLTDANFVIAADFDGDGDLDPVASSLFFRSSPTNPNLPTRILYRNRLEDCNRNAVPDSCDIAASAALDCNSNAVIDACEPFKAGDFDGDAMVDAVDWSSFEKCLAGPDQGVAFGAACPGLCIAAFDSDSDGDLDLGDFAEFVRRFDFP